MAPNYLVRVRLVHDVLLPIAALVNGGAIRRIASDAVTYWSMVLDSLDIILAENLPGQRSASHPAAAPSAE